ncbi:MAG: ribose 5-phosphate isomerase B [Anaerolineae bacterium]|jgi:ribose 5-phosphate isomerase B|nr:ribose 5-phosphate isomerase B [Anaerolineae bacterium]
MNYISETDIRNIVQKALAQAVPPASPAPASAVPATAENPCGTGKKRTIAVGSDHGGYELKTIVIAYLQELGHTVIDCGTTGKEAVDYPDFALAVAEKIRSHEACRGIVIDAAGIGSCMAANKVPGVRAAMCVDYATASNSREHNNANVLSLGAGLLGVNQVKLIIKTFLETDFGGGRHARRVDKITDIEKKYMKEG